MTFMDKVKSFFYDPVVKAEYRSDKVLTLTRQSGKVEQYHGSCTVWTDYPDMYDVGVMEENRLYRYWKLCRHSRQGIWINKNV